MVGRVRVLLHRLLVPLSFFLLWPAAPSLGSTNPLPSGPSSPEGASADSSTASPGSAGPLAPEPDIPLPAGTVHRIAHPAPLHWVPLQSRAFRYGRGQGSIWLLTLEKAPVGTILTEPPRTIMADRLRIARKGHGGETVLAYALQVANTEVALLRPDDPRLSSYGPALDDPVRPWPNDCFLSLMDTARPLDLNQNGRFELAVRRFAPLPEPGGSGIVLIEADAQGRPRILPLSELVEIVRFDGGILTDITWPPNESMPVLEAQYPPLHRCRFLNQLGLRGESGCESCCDIRVILRNVRPGFYRPSYVRDLHYSFLDGLQGDLGMIRDGDPDTPLRPVEEAALCRAAAFFYLTGTGSGTRLELEKVLGRRARLLPVRLLLDRLDRYFLRDPI